MAEHDDSVFRAMMEDVASIVLGEAGEHLNEKLTKRQQGSLRYGTNGSLEIDLTKGTWFDFEEQIGGGVIELLKAFKGLDQSGAVRWLIDHGFLEERGKEEPPEDFEVPGGPIPDFIKPAPIACFEYYDDKGKLAYQVLKFPKTADIRYQSRRPYTGKTWIWGLTAGEWGKHKKSNTYFRTKEGKTYDDVIHVEDVTRWLYRRDEVLRAKKKGETVHLMEGEKDVETMRKWGFTATTNAGGAKFWNDSFDDDLSGCDVIIWNDNDQAGRDRAAMRAATLKGKAKRVRVMDLALHWKEAPEKGDVTDWKEKTLGTKERLIDLMKFAVEPEAPKSKFGAIHWRDIGKRKVTNNYLIHKLITMGSTAILAGASGAGKSFMGIHIGMCVARGIEWFDHGVKKGGVAYQAGEGGLGVEKRLIAYKQHFKVPEEEDIPFVLLPSKVDLFSKDGDTQAFIDDLRIQAMQMSEPLALVVIDTFNKAMAGAEEISGRDIGIVLGNVDKIKKATGAAVLIVHHLNAAGEKLRGHSSIHADADEVILISNDKETGIKTLKVSKLKDDDVGEEIKFNLTRIVIDFDEDGQEVSSCVVMTVTEKQAFAKEKEKQGYYVKPQERKILNAFFKARSKYGDMALHDDKNYPRAAWGKTVVHWNDYVEIVMSQQMGADDSEEGKKKSRESIAKDFMRNSEYMRKHDIIMVEKPFMWWDGKPIQGYPETFPKKNKDIDPQAQDSMLETFDDPDIEAFLESERNIPF